MLRHGLLLLGLTVPLALLLTIPAFTDPPAYHDFADRRPLLGIPNFADVASSIPYLLLGVAGLRACLRTARGGTWLAWVAFFAGVALIGPGSVAYHWDPSPASLFWDRLPMGLAFAAFFVAVLGDHVDPRLAKPLLVPALLAGLGSVLYWHAYADLRLYAAMQTLPVLAILLTLLLYPARYSHRSWLLVAFACYALAKAAELYDHAVFAAAAGAVSGHTAKHLLSALAIWALIVMLKRRRPVGYQ